MSNTPGAIEDGEVHLWFAKLSGPIEHLYEILSEDERERAARFSASVDRDRFIIARGLLRTLLGAYRHCPPRSLRFDYNPYGKPFLLGAESLEFNLSHSEDVLLLGVTRGRRIGVDMERVDPEIDCERLAKRFLSAHEYAEWDSLPLREKSDAWFRHWTRKEAYLKAVGVGLTQSLNFDEATGWQELSIESCPDGFAATVVVEGKAVPEIHRYHYRW